MPFRFHFILLCSLLLAPALARTATNPDARPATSAAGSDVTFEATSLFRDLSFLDSLNLDDDPVGPEFVGPAVPWGDDLAGYGPPLSELRGERSSALATTWTPKVWPLSMDGEGTLRLAGPPTPISTPHQAFAGPMTSTVVSPPAGPPLPAAGPPTAYGFVWPVGGEASFQNSDENGRPGFRVVRDFSPGPGRHTHHMGVDLSNRQYGSTVRALADGIVALVSDRAHGDKMHTGWGNLIILAHRLPGGDVVYSLLAHLKDRSIRVRPGDRVTAGEPIAEVGATGHADGPHLHLEMRKFLNWNVLDMLPQGWQHMGFLNPLGFLGNHLVTFPDLPESHWAYPCVMQLVRMGVVSVGPSFGPDQQTTGSEFADMMGRAFGPAAGHLLGGLAASNQPIQLASAMATLQNALAAPGATPDLAARESLLLKSSLEQATGRPMIDPTHVVTHAEAAVLLKAALGADNREPSIISIAPSPVPGASMAGEAATGTGGD